MASRRHMLRSRHRFLALLAVLLLVLSALVNTHSANTTAAWTDGSVAKSQLSAATLGNVRNLSCFDIGTGLLGTPLLRNQLVLAWEAPEGFDDLPVKYRITWDGGLLGARGEAYVTDGSNQYDYRAVLLGQILSFDLEFNVYPEYESWVGPPKTYTATTIALLLSVTMDC